MPKLLDFLASRPARAHQQAVTPPAQRLAFGFTAHCRRVDATSKWDRRPRRKGLMAKAQALVNQGSLSPFLPTFQKKRQNGGYARQHHHKNQCRRPALSIARLRLPFCTIVWQRQHELRQMRIAQTPVFGFVQEARGQKHVRLRRLFAAEARRGAHSSPHTRS